jgi:hypothetical protein
LRYPTSSFVRGSLAVPRQTPRRPVTLKLHHCSNGRARALAVQSGGSTAAVDQLEIPMQKNWLRFPA